ncbi:hypothetical protein A1O3_04555 [Capronia epimyces CBS 606.96]|uniref:Uncharacterized protein n=1 Tax=Capronia epimyces CBS 606.96 TaxID=1182542 RepID=W9YZ74_9EURO|nr:uncharacterized protein A1O3_04555 [Capronia epimyces CBS 606.96]EXJ87594.1 hypothetical protein A1O3_04555 [Capronia epimyces CBS 606.96]
MGVVLSVFCRVRSAIFAKMFRLVKGEKTRGFFKSRHASQYDTPGHSFPAGFFPPEEPSASILKTPRGTAEKKADMMRRPVVWEQPLPKPDFVCLTPIPPAVVRARPSGLEPRDRTYGRLGQTKICRPEARRAVETSPAPCRLGMIRHLPPLTSITNHLNNHHGGFFTPAERQEICTRYLHQGYLVKDDENGCRRAKQNGHHPFLPALSGFCCPVDRCVAYTTPKTVQFKMCRRDTTLKPQPCTVSYLWGEPKHLFVVLEDGDANAAES